MNRSFLVTGLLLTLLSTAWFVSGSKPSISVCSTVAFAQESPRDRQSTSVPKAVDDHAEPHGDGHAAEPKLGERLNLASVAPFCLLLLCVAVFPLFFAHWWEHNKNKGLIVLLLGLPVIIYVGTFGHAGHHALEHALKEYISFLLLLSALFVISGGIYVRGVLPCSPLFNTLLLGMGALVASVIGTTGASMLLIRPLLRANARRTRVVHVVVFFIFVVSNCGGLLTPLGDPPLFLGFLKGVPFLWTLRLFPQWAFVNGCLLSLFFVWDTIAMKREAAMSITQSGSAADLPQLPLTEDLPSSQPSFGIEGQHNFLGLIAIVAVIYCSGQAYGHEFLNRLLPWGQRGSWPFGVQEALMALIALTCFAITSRGIREKNRFGFGPILEVAVLFAGIFATMIPALAILNVHGKSLGIESPAHFFWASGILSSFLDNAPTYLTFAATACGLKGVDTGDGPYLAAFLNLPPESGATALLVAISCGSVFMGANTYIGNGPNFMVKAIAEENNVRMPGFFGYMAYSCGILIPIFIAVTLIFFR